MAKLAKQETPKEVAKKVSLLKMVQISIQSALDNEQEVNAHRQSMGTENYIFQVIKNAVPLLKTADNVIDARNMIYDLSYKTPDGIRSLGRKGATCKEFPKLRYPAPRVFSNLVTLLLKAVSSCKYVKDEKGIEHEVKFGYSEFLNPKGLHAYDVINSDDKKVKGLKRLIKDKENCPDRNIRNKAKAIRQSWLDKDKAENKEKSKLSDVDYLAWVEKTYKS